MMIGSDSGERDEHRCAVPTVCYEVQESSRNNKVRNSSNVEFRQSECSFEDHSMLTSWPISSMLSRSR